ncbi:hypothetical protein HYW18_02130 [Candidatus Uhrbacteria bacterium]|nr:hypothetical protein [Candidatus Uhrbacteria bacterium]
MFDVYRWWPIAHEAGHFAARHVFAERVARTSEGAGRLLNPEVVEFLPDLFAFGIGFELDADRYLKGLFGVVASQYQDSARFGAAVATSCARFAAMGMVTGLVEQYSPRELLSWGAAEFLEAMEMIARPPVLILGRWIERRCTDGAEYFGYVWRRLADRLVQSRRRVVADVLESPYLVPAAVEVAVSCCRSVASALTTLGASDQSAPMLRKVLRGVIAPASSIDSTGSSSIAALQKLRAGESLGESIPGSVILAAMTRYRWSEFNDNEAWRREKDSGRAFQTTVAALLSLWRLNSARLPEWEV